MEVLHAQLAQMNFEETLDLTAEVCLRFLIVILEPNPGDGRRPPPGWEKSLMDVQKKQDDITCIVGPRTAARESRKR